MLPEYSSWYSVEGRQLDLGGPGISRRVRLRSTAGNQREPTEAQGAFPPGIGLEDDERHFFYHAFVSALLETCRFSNPVCTRWKFSPVAATLGQPLGSKSMRCATGRMFHSLPKELQHGNTIVYSKNRAICHKAGNTRVGKGASLA
jgi:hypothetical protein